jgi:hypothetical protein
MDKRLTQALAVTVLGAVAGRWASTGRIASIWKKAAPSGPSPTSSQALDSIPPAPAVATVEPMSSTSRIARTSELAKVGAQAGVGYAVHKTRRAIAPEAKKAELDAAYELKSSEQVAEALGNMKGVLMKLGQMASFLNEGFPEHLRDQLAQLQSDAPPMASELAASVIAAELGDRPEMVFAEWDPVPLAAASIGQVHRARRLDGRWVAVKVQYPGVDKAIAADLDNTAMLTSMLGMLFKGLEVGPFVAELKARVSEELDYTLEAKRQQRFVDMFDGHPTIYVPHVHHDLSTSKVLVTDLSQGERFASTVDWTQDERNLAAETIYRFVFRSFNRHLVFNGDPHPGNYLVDRSGPMGVRVTFLDFGLVKDFTTAEMATFHQMIRYQVTERDPVLYRKTVEDTGLLLPGAPYSTEELMDYFGYFYHPVLEDKPFAYTRSYAREALKRTFDPAGQHSEMMKWFNLPPSFVVLNRIQWGLNAVLASLDATANWRAISEELWPWTDSPPSTPLGEAEHAWLEHHPNRDTA